MKYLIIDIWAVDIVKRDSSINSSSVLLFKTSFIISGLKKFKSRLISCWQAILQCYYYRYWINFLTQASLNIWHCNQYLHTQQYHNKDWRYQFTLKDSLGATSKWKTILKNCPVIRNQSLIGIKYEISNTIWLFQGNLKQICIIFCD